MATPLVLPAAPASALDIPALQGAQLLPGYPAPVQHPGAPVPQPFTPDYLAGYISDISSYSFGVYADVIAGFDDLRAHHPEIMAQNLDITVANNNAAASNPQLVAQAQKDALADKDGVLLAFSDALGGELGGYFRQALAENRLPKTTFLLGNGYLARAGGLASSTFVEKELYGYKRPFVVAPERIHRYEVADRELYDASSKSFPSGHTNQATWTTTLLAQMLPELAPQILARGSEAGYHRTVMGVHYPLDVIGGRMTGTAAAADRWNDPRMRDALNQAKAELRAELEWRAGKPLAQVIAGDSAYRSTAAAVAEYTQRMNYGFAPVYNTQAPMIVPQAAPDLLLAKYPELSYEQRAEILRATAAPAGSPLDDQSPRGSWQRINLAAAFAAKVSVDSAGKVTVSGI
ncbi:phosphatase PAP2 family protein [Corynebacterium sp. sy017]|uniref:acid phosphatase n=1 Tax=Corynebacterium sp. sy017 TaxID=2499527 RepID=UPI0011865184|nr:MULTISPECIES: phosphatase PAP2 family protein [unclassified Corynebacterium]MBP3088127.1 phosphatase PAP2 family protein [Corynebacterium sp. sy017]QDZ43591.1 phosphatase PAP2 family protein [Corynebacterium sp. sy039]TSD92765.1 phosphatase PAP2 family protein [Corynebacterium sp. SY003]